MAEYRKRLPSRITKIYYPVDRRKFVRRAMASINPQAIILLEAEIWPNFLWRAHDLRIPVFLANARLSDRSASRYQKFGWLFRPLFGSFAGVSCQNEEDAQQLRRVGCRPEALQVVGNLKFDGAGLTEKRELDVPGLLRQIGVANDALILVAGSTHDGEELLLADIASRLRKKFPNFFLILVPRHNERCPELGRKLKAQGVKFLLRNAVFAATQLPIGQLDCLVVNTIGELKFFYQSASVVFIGKSLKAFGGQNPIEPAALGKPVVFGPNMQNFKDITRILLAKDAAVQVKNTEALEATLTELLGNQTRRAELGRHAMAAVAENQGAIERTVEMLLPELARRDLYIVPKHQMPPA
jgi:3-deoxy-D-manno-octulosonic-acid transferase